MYCLPKLQKANMPLRPIVSTIVYNLSTCSNKTLQPLVNNVNHVNTLLIRQQKIRKTTKSIQIGTNNLPTLTEFLTTYLLIRKR